LCSFDDFIPIKDLLCLIIHDDTIYLERLEKSKNPPTLNQIEIVLRHSLNIKGKFYSKEDLRV